MKGIGVLFLVLLALAAATSGISHAETTCARSGCDITITLKVAFAGANASYASAAENETESFWNGPQGFRTTGECKCTVEVKMETALVADCRNPPAGYHCITVTKFFKPDGTYDNPPRNQTNITNASIYVGYVNGIAKGNGSNSQQGWFSDLMSRPVSSANPAGPHYLDFAHEAGHLMGLNHTNSTNSIMNNTLASSPSQEDIDGIVREICGEGACPDSCCCGNGVIEKDKGENCDPRAAPTGCGAGASCCPVCCNCFKPACVPAQGEYPDSASCGSACGAGFGCYLNYRTGCWNCIMQNAVPTGSCLDGTRIRGNTACDHEAGGLTENGMRGYAAMLNGMPVIGGLFANERINFATDEGDAGHIVTEGGAVAEFGLRPLEDPSVTVRTDRETLLLLEKGGTTVRQAMAEGRITVQGEGMLGGMRFAIYGMMLGIYNAMNPLPQPEEYAAPSESASGCGPGYVERMEGVFEGGSAPAGNEGYGPVPDDAIRELPSSGLYDN